MQLCINAIKLLPTYFSVLAEIHTLLLKLKLLLDLAFKNSYKTKKKTFLNANKADVMEIL